MCSTTPTAFLVLAAIAGTLIAQEPPAAGKASEPHAPGNWHRLFDGKTLDGWTTVGGRYDGAAVWTVEDGAIVGRVGENQAGGLLYTDRAWHSFDFECETKIDWPFDSGVFVRMAPRGKGAQVTLDWRPTGEIGGIYSDGWLEHRPEGAERFRRDAWNHVRVRCTGRDLRLEFWLNGERLTDWRLPGGTEGFAPTGLIGVQVHGGLDEPATHAARFRAIRLRELPVFDLDEFACDDAGSLTALPESGWTDLLDPELSAWAAHGGDGRGFEVEAGVLKLLTAGGAHELRTKADYEDFELRLDFKIVRGANSGVFLRADRERSDSAFSGAEIQVLDDFHWEEDTGTELKPWQLTGSLYGAVPAGHQGALHPLGCWNSYHLRYQGTRLRVELNGIELYDVDTADLEPEAGAPFAERAPAGFVGLQRHAPATAADAPAYAWYRNVFVRRL